MKRFLSILLVLVLALGVFAACQEPGEKTPAATLDDAKTYLAELYKDSNPKPEKDFDVVGKVIVNGVTFTVTWTASLEEIKIKESTKKDFYTVDLPDVNTEAKEYVLTATITDAEGATATVEVKKTLPVVANVSGIVTSPVEGTAYKLFFDQKSLGKVLFLLGEASNDQNKYVKTTIDPKEAPDFYVEVVEGGYKIYTTKNNAKVYLRAATTKSDDGKISKYLGFDDKGTVFAYNADYDAWYSTIDGINYVMGTYSTYDTASISEDSYYKTEDKRLTQYAVCFITKAEGEAMTPTEGPKDPTELTSIADVLAIGAAKDNNTYTAEKYLVKGTIVEIKSEQYGNMYIQDEAGNKLYVYGTYNSDGSTRFDAMNPQPKVGDVVTLMSIVGKYNDEVQFKNAWVMELQAVACTNHVYDNACDADCNVCKETRTPADHVYDNACDADCNVCKETRTPAAHVYDNECVDADCNVCGATREVAGHKYTDECDAECNVCSEARTAPHKVTAACDTQCDLCAAPITATAEHTFTAACDNTCDVCGSTRAVTCKDEDGDGRCDSCNKVVDQAAIDAGKIEVEVGKVVVPSNVHAKGETVLPATGTDFAEVTITWEATNATIANGKVTYTNNGAADVTVTLTATFKCGATTDTKTYTVKVTAHAYDNACDANCNVCDVARTPADHVYDNHLDTTCNVCNGGTREATPCVDADKNDKCDNCGADVAATPVYDIVLSVDTLGLPSEKYTGTADASATATVNGVTFEFIQMGNYGDGIQMRDKADKGTSMIWNTEAFGKKIVRIELTYSSTKSTYDNPDAVIFTFGNAVGEATYTTKLSTQKDVKTYTITPEGDFTFFKLEYDYDYTAYWESITIVFGDGSDPNAPSDNPTETPEQPSEGNLPQALTELKTGDVVAIVAPAYNMALSADKVSEGSYYNKGVDVSSGLTGLTDAEKFTVTVNADGSYTFTSVSGIVIALADSYSSLNADGANKSWALEEKGGATGVYYLKNTVRGNYLEWYASKGNWSSYATSSLSDLFEISFYKVG